jgi:putative FmdB family regulatory protein
MPIYEYECTKCGQISEAWQRFSDAPLSKCEHCSGKLKKLISHSTFHLKGTGWYVTDYAGKSKSKPEKTEKADSAKSEAKKTEGTKKTEASKKKDTKD